LFNAGQDAGSFELELDELEDEDEGAGAIGVTACVAAGADVEMAAEAETVGAFVVGAALVCVTIPLAVVAPEVAVVVAVVAGTGEFPVAPIEEKPEDVEGRFDDVVVDDVCSTGAVGFAALNPNINPNPNPSASARIINTANPHKT
jgi:hypothetical protein